ncbi:MAG: SIS domain-containing protein, partial [Phycisphaerae bacterium]|nr:SIS domain-containing protein [Phycisphaerae bacterium]
GRDLLSAVRAACRELTGSYAIAVLCDKEPNLLVTAKKGGSPIIIGHGDKQAFLASDIPAVLPYTREIISLKDGDFAILAEDLVQVVDAEGRILDREFQAVQWDPVSAEKGGFDHFMQKEIFEQPRAVTDTIGTRINESEMNVDLDGIEFTKAELDGLSGITLVACGTSYYASQLGKYMIEQIAGIPCEVDLASEFRYRRPIVGNKRIVIPVSQSGETADTLAA